MAVAKIIIEVFLLICFSWKLPNFCLKKKKTERIWLFFWSSEAETRCLKRRFSQVCACACISVWSGVFVCMDVCVCEVVFMHVWGCMCEDVYAYGCMCVFVWMCATVCIWVSSHLGECVCMCMNASGYVCAFACVLGSVRFCVCLAYASVQVFVCAYARRWVCGCFSC